MILLNHILKFFIMESRKKNDIIKVTFVLLLFLNLKISGQSDLLDDYINQGLTSNLALQQKQDSYEESIEKLREARGLFYPTVSLNARYTVAQGGRTIEFPVGDLLNPVYSTLNSLTGSNQFPNVENEEFNFYRPTEHETKLKVVQPIFNPTIHYNYKIKADLAQAKYADAGIYKRYLVAEIKTAYFNYLKTKQLNILLNNTRKLLEENKRVNEKLFANDKVTIDYIYRSETELSKLDQRKAEAIRMEQSAASYFNFLLNRPFDSEIKADTNSIIPQPAGSLDKLKDNALNTREELSMLESYSSAAYNNYKFNKAGKFPTLLGAVDYGFQGTNYSFTGKDDFLLASLVLRWDLFKGMQNNAKIQQAKLEQQITEKKYTELQLAIKLEITDAWYALQASEKSIQTSKLQVETTRKAFHIIEKKYNQGQASLIEYIDARTVMTNAQENYIIAKYTYLITYAEYERVTGIYDFTK